MRERHVTLDPVCLLLLLLRQKKVAAATAAMNLELLNEALETAIQLGLRTPAVEAGVSFRDELAEKEGTVAAIVAACDTLQMKASSKGGINAFDVEVLAATLAASAGAVAAMAARPEVVAAQGLAAQMGQVLAVQDQLRACEAKGAAADRTELFEAMNEVFNKHTHNAE